MSLILKPNRLIDVLTDMKNLLNLVFIFTLISCSNAQTSKQIDSDKTLKFEITKSNDEWKKELSEDAYNVLREKGTERAYTGKFYKHDENGVYTCGACGEPLFSSKTKFESGSGWPSFYDVVENGNVLVSKDSSHGMQRDEVVCGKCGGHLGHVFEDGPRPTGLRYCINSISLDFEKEK